MTTTVRPTPFSLAFGDLAAARFPAIDQALTAAGTDPRDRDAFLLLREVSQLLRELRPDEGLGEGVEAFAALVHAAYLFHRGGEPIVTVDEETLRLLVSEAPGPRAAPPSPREPAYVQLPPLRVWGIAREGAPAEPLDGWFATGGKDGLSLVAVFGMHPGREGFTVVQASGTRPDELRRPDGTALFAPMLAGGMTAGLASLSGAEELLELAWRVEARR
ncbi:MAG TPA: hypothetical protein VJ817_00465 [Gemmatimonadales bacterium]|nr:hypothetical protein [Gemmatimonadales bacterium]